MTPPHVVSKPADGGPAQSMGVQSSRKIVRSACERCRLSKHKVGWTFVHAHAHGSHLFQCSGTQPCVRCVRAKATCVFPGRRDERLQQDLQDHKSSIHKIFHLLRIQDGSPNARLQEIASSSQNAEDFIRRISSLPQDLKDEDDESDQM